MPVTWIPFAFPGLRKVRCAFGARGQAGASSDPSDELGRGNISFDVGDEPERVLANRKRMREGLGFASWQELKQVHGTGMVFDPEEHAIEEPGRIQADGLATSKPGQALVIKTADCQPILLAHASGRYVAGLHSGWRGNRLGFPVSGVRDFCARYDLAPEDVYAARGPSLGPAASEFVHFEREWGEDYLPFFDQERRAMRLWALTRAQLVEAGLREENIFGLDLCTYELGALFFSYRRNKHCGRQANLIWIEE
jgi:YfiH family protein